MSASDKYRTETQLFRGAPASAVRQAIDAIIYYPREHWQLREETEGEFRARMQAAPNLVQVFGNGNRYRFDRPNGTVTSADRARSRLILAVSVPLAELEEWNRAAALALASISPRREDGDAIVALAEECREFFRDSWTLVVGRRIVQTDAYAGIAGTPLAADAADRWPDCLGSGRDVLPQMKRDRLNRGEVALRIVAGLALGGREESTVTVTARERRRRGPKVKFPESVDQKLIDDWAQSGMTQTDFERDREGVRKGDIRRAHDRLRGKAARRPVKPL